MSDDIERPKKKERMKWGRQRSRGAEGQRRELRRELRGKKFFILFFESAKFYENENAALSEIVRREGNVKTDRFESCTSK